MIVRDDPAEAEAAPWPAVLRALREARGVTQDGWAAQLGVSRKTVQRWEAGERVPDPGAERALLAYCAERDLFRPFRHGPLAGLALTPDRLHDLLAEARLSLSPGAVSGPGSVPAGAAGTWTGGGAAVAVGTAGATNLPMALTSFVGRERELAMVRRLLAGSRLLTLTGAGGGGKTRLALEVAGEVLWAYPHGVWLVELAALSEPSLVVQAVAEALGLHAAEPRPPLEAIKDFVRGRSLLLVLDNCEHLQVACAEVMEALLRASPGLEVLATSREPLGVPGETVFRVPPLTVDVNEPDAAGGGAWPAPGVSRGPPAGGRRVGDAVALFVERARLYRPEFELTAENEDAVVSICRQLDGMPLAIELAAARVTMLSVAQIAGRLQDRLSLLTGGSRTALPRQQTLRATLDWSHDLLSGPERALLRRLAVFAGGFDLEGAEAIGGDGPPVLDLLASLVDKSLVIAEGAGVGVRYRMLETVRQYAAEKLDAAGEADATRDTHLAWYLAQGEAAGAAAQGPEEPPWLARLEEEHDNLRAALAWALARGDGTAALRLAAGLPRFWELRGYMSEGRRWLGQALEAGADAPAAVRTLALKGASVLAQMQGDYVASRAYAEESLALSERAGDRLGVAEARWNLGYVALRSGDHALARILLGESLVLHTELGCTRGIAGAHGALGVLALREGDTEAARTHFGLSLALHHEIGDTDGVAAALVDVASATGDAGSDELKAALLEESLALYRVIGSRQGIALALGNLGMVTWSRRDYERAQALLEESLTLYREVGDRRGIARLLGNQGLVALHQREYARAAAWCRESLELYRAVGDQQGIAHALVMLAGAAFGQGRAERAASLFGAGAAMRDRLGLALPAVGRRSHDRTVAAVRACLGEPAFTRAWSVGEAMSPEEAVVFALVTGGG